MLYSIDAEDRLDGFGPEWDALADGNKAPELRGAQLLGRPFFQFVDGALTKYAWRGFFHRVRDAGPLAVRAKCSTSTLERTYDISMLPKRNGGIEFFIDLARAEVAPYHPFWDIDAVRTAETVTACSFCESNLTPLGDWEPVRTASEDISALRQSHPPQIRRDVCHSCLSQVHHGGKPNTAATLSDGAFTLYAPPRR